MTDAILVVTGEDKSRIGEHIQEIAPTTSSVGSFIISKGISPSSFLESIMNSPVHLARYINRVYFSDKVSGKLDDINELDFVGKKIRVIAFPQSLENHLLTFLDEGVDLDPKNFTHFLSVVYYEGRYYYGVYDRYLFFRKPDVEKDLVSRAYHKVEEAFYVFGIKPQQSWRVLDIGAAPGGWSQYLSDKVSKIVAVDPGELKIERSNVVHLRKKIEDVGLELGRQRPFDMVICDMNKEPRQAARIILDNTRFMRQGTEVILTLKLIFKGPAGKEFLVEQAKTLLSGDFEDIKVEWLLANSKQERTLFARKK